MSLKISNYRDSSYYVNKNSSAKGKTNVDSTFLSSNNSVKAYYNELIEKHPDLNISAGVYKVGSTGGSGLGNVMIHPKYLEKAANDPNVSAVLEKNLCDIPAAERWLANECRMSGIELIAGGVIIDENGEMSSWSMTRRTDDIKDSGLLEYKKIDLNKILSKSKNNQKEDKESEIISLNYIIENKGASEITNKMFELDEYRKASTQHYNVGKLESMDRLLDTKG